MNLRETLFNSAYNLEQMAMESAKQAADPDSSKYWREYDRAQAIRLFDTAQFYRQWAERETQ